MERRIYDKILSLSKSKKREWLLKTYYKAHEFFHKAKRLIPCTYLCLKYPFLKKGGATRNKRFFQTNCWYYCIDPGWRKAFGRTMCDELKKALKFHGFLKAYVISDIKEKCGGLSISDEGAPSEIHDILLKYEYISERTCIICGRRAKYMTDGWHEPYCEDCINEISPMLKPNEYYKDIEWYGYNTKQI